MAVGRKLYKRRVWGGFVADRIDYRMIDTGHGGWGQGGAMMTLAVYTSKAIAKKHYEDVRRIEVRELPRRGRRHGQ